MHQKIGNLETLFLHRVDNDASLFHFAEQNC